MDVQLTCGGCGARKVLASSLTIQDLLGDYFRDHLIAASLKPESSISPQTRRMAISAIIGSRLHGSLTAQLIFPGLPNISAIIGSRLHGSSTTIGMYRPAASFPRSFDRGFIEAQKVVPSGEIGPENFRDHLIAASLKLGIDHMRGRIRVHFRDHLIAASLKREIAQGVDTIDVISAIIGSRLHGSNALRNTLRSGYSDFRDHLIAASLKRIAA